MSKEAFEALYNEYCTQTSRLREPSALEIRTFIVENAILPLGSQIIHDVAPHTNSFLMYGFPNTGKTMMAFALANCSGSLFFNLSPGVFSSVKSIPKTIQLVFYLARMKAPSVIYIDNVEKVFAKKAGKKKDPLLARGKKMKKELVKAMNALLPSDRVLVVGVTNEPWLADSSLVQRFPKALYFPLPDYAARQQLLETFIQKKIGKEKAVIDPNTINILAMLTDSYSTGQLKEMVEETLTQHRIHRLLQQPLEASDFVDSLAKTKKPTKAEVDQMNTFYNTLPFALRRADADDFKETEEEAKKKKSAPKKKKKSTA
ncbi:ATPase family associated with various cellular activities (AAA), putative [Angomonas deanei]|uniref:ATPase family associated with various cellular activities (AAA), putative n=1 Tax=Angomonas deanei TaxID=59799 RepID=A0A7G2CJW5_9TRYP|nr:ATPase family associated with various cellular activities (AAA), putative [Angomonas deanei]